MPESVSESASKLRDLPAVDTLLSDAALQVQVARHGVMAVRDEIRSLQQNMRETREVPSWATDPAGYSIHVAHRLRRLAYTPVYNLTGTIIHTNLGRALLESAQWREIEPLVTQPINLEYDLDAGKRGDRDLIVEERLKRLTGCEAATIVNNNAAALLLVLNTFGLGRKVPVSRGELIEIGGSFRLPELMTRSGCTLVEVGTTNRTHLRDFEAVASEAAMFLKVHPSNYHISGFSTEVSAGELATLADRNEVPSCVDLGSGTLIDLTRWGLPAEPTPQSILNEGIDLVTFSGDKLLGSVQAGIIAGSKPLLAQIKKNPLKRALRADKITLAILENTLRLYESPEDLPNKLPLLRTLTTPITELEKRARTIQAALPSSWRSSIEESEAQIGSGALPDKTIQSVALVIDHADKSANEIEKLLRDLAPPVIGRIRDGRVWLDMRGAFSVDGIVDAMDRLPE